MNVTSVNRQSSLQKSTGYAVLDRCLDWDNRPYKGMTALSKEEIFAQVREITVKQVRAESDGEFNELNAQMISLFTQYASFVSPDRDSLLANGMKTISQQCKVGAEQEKPEFKDFWDYIFRTYKEKGGIETFKKYRFAGGGSAELRPSASGGEALIISHNGSPVLSVQSDGRIGWQLSPEESKLRQEIFLYSERIRKNEKAKQNNNEFRA